MKIKIKNSFWNQDIETQRDKLVNIIFWGSIFFMCNMAYFLFIGNIFMLIVNSLIFTLYTLIQISYNKREKNDGTN